MQEITHAIDGLAKYCGGTVSVCVRDVRGAFDFAYNADAVISSASTIKVPILVEALRQARDGEIDLESLFQITRQRKCDGSGVLTHLHDGIEVTFRDLLTLMIIVSDNTATNLVIDTVGLEKVNKTLDSFGLTKTRLQRKMYDWEAIAAGRDNIIAAKEGAELLAKVARRELLGEKWDELLHEILRAQQFTKLGLLLPEEVLANKTGQVNDAVNDFGIVTTEDFCYSIAVFTQGAPSLGEAGITIGRISKIIYDEVLGKSC
ncbi:MAG: serine hydrolase [Armatimonadota bacterium]|jgi:beta-lactamase class A